MPPPPGFQMPTPLPPDHYLKMFDTPNTEAGGPHAAVWLPKAPAPSTAGHPVVVYIHGGAFIGGSAKGFGREKDALAYLSEEGVVAVSIEYRMAPHHDEGGTPMDMIAADLRAAWAWVTDGRCEAALLGVGTEITLDAARIGVWGHSAGGWAAAYLGAVASSPRPLAVLGYFGPLNWPQYASWEGDTPPPPSAPIHALIARQLTHHQAATASPFGPPSPDDSPSVRDRKELMQEAEAVQQVGFVASGRKPGNDPYVLATEKYPPTRFVHGTEDPVVWFELSRAMHEKLVGLGVESELVPIEGAGHGWPVEKGAEGVAGERWQKQQAALEWFVGKIKA